MSQITTPLGRIGGSLMLAAALATGLFGISTISIGDDDSDDDAPLAAFAENPLYSEECGACHLAYPPGLLPQASWRGIMDGLADHFGENAELDDSTANELRNWLADNAADAPSRQRRNKLLRGVVDEAPLRITELPYFVDEHDDIPAHMVAGNAEVGSFSNCDSCHKGASRGEFDDDTVDIPGFGRFDD